MTGELYRREKRLVVMLSLRCSNTEGKTGGGASGHAGGDMGACHEHGGGDQSSEGHARCL